MAAPILSRRIRYYEIDIRDTVGIYEHVLVAFVAPSPKYSSELYCPVGYYQFDIRDTVGTHEHMLVAFVAQSPKGLTKISSFHSFMLLLP